MSQINRVPWGLQSLLGSKNFGRNPSELQENIQPVLDMQPHVGYEILNADADYVVATAVGDYAELTIPDNEAWGVVGVSGDTRVVTSNAEYFMNVLLVYPANAGGAFLKFFNIGYYSKQSSTSSSIGQGTSVMFPSPVIFGPGTRFQNAMVEALSLTSVDIRLTVLYYRYEV